MNQFRKRFIGFALLLFVVPVAFGQDVPTLEDFLPEYLKREAKLEAAYRNFYAKVETVNKGDLKNECSASHFWSLHSGGANFSFVDGSVRTISYSGADIVVASSTRNGNEIAINPD